MKHTGFNGMLCVIAAFLCLSALTAPAHEPSKSYLNLTLRDGVWTGDWRIPIADLRKATPTLAEGDASVSATQIQARASDIAAYAFSHLSMACDGKAATPRLLESQPALEQLSDGQYLLFEFAFDGAARAQTLSVKYTLFFETNSLHRGLARIEAGAKTIVAAFSPEHPTQEFRFDLVQPWRQFLTFLREGVWHIWTGYDHILFLLALLLPAVLVRENGHWREVGAFRPAFFNVLKIVTAFTIAHSLTLSLATLGLVRLPSRLTESAIAVTVALAAANNLWPVTRERGWIVAFGFGLVHGFGFATALSDLGLARGSLALTLFGFNLGVEIGQLSIVAAFLPAAFALRRTWLYQAPVLRLGSACIVMIAAAWGAERVMDVKFMPF